MTDANITDITVIGGGPTGLYAAFYAGLRGISCRVVDALPQLGGQLMALYPEKYIFDVGGLPKILAKDLANNMIEQGTQFGPEVVLGAEVQEMIPEGDHFRLVTPKGDFLTRTVCVTAGKGALNPRVLECPGWDEHHNETGGAHTHVRQIEDFRDRRVLIVGGGDSAVDWALSLKGIARVTMVHRRPKFRAAPDSAARLEAAAARGEIEMAVPYQLRALEGDGSRLSGVVLATLKGETRTVPADHLLAFFGLSMELGPIAHWGLGLDHSHVSVEPSTCRTNLPGVFAIGDIAAYPGKLKLILQGFSEAAMAAHAIHPLVFPGEALHFEYSTAKGVQAPGAATQAKPAG